MIDKNKIFMFFTKSSRDGWLERKSENYPDSVKNFWPRSNKSVRRHVYLQAIIIKHQFEELPKDIVKCALEIYT